MINLQFIGTGSAFNKEFGQTNAIITKNNKKLAIDCGNLFWQRAHNQDLSVFDVDVIYVTHLHGDHIGGLEEYGYCRYFHPESIKGKIIIHQALVGQLWQYLSCTMGKIGKEGESVYLTDLFDVEIIQQNFEWEGIKFQAVESPHVGPQSNYGLYINDEDQSIYYTGDVNNGNYEENAKYYASASKIYHDCENAYNSGVHFHIDELKKLPNEIKNKIYLMHYNSAPVDSEFKVASI